MKWKRGALTVTLTVALFFMLTWSLSESVCRLGWAPHANEPGLGLRALLLALFLIFAGPLVHDLVALASSAANFEPYRGIALRPGVEGTSEPPISERAKWLFVYPIYSFGFGAAAVLAWISAAGCS